MGFHQNVFVNCPFDQDYAHLLRPLLFTIRYLGFTPRIALEALDSGAARVSRIASLISQSRYAIHDLSRLQAKREGEYYRLNMPFELGIDFGCRLFGSTLLRTKRCLVLETDRYRYQTAISDLAGSDIAAHDDNPETLVAEVRNWLNHQAGLRAPGPARIWVDFLNFMADNGDELKRRGFSDADIERLPVGELLKCITDWVGRRERR